MKFARIGKWKSPRRWVGRTFYRNPMWKHLRFIIHRFLIKCRTVFPLYPGRNAAWMDMAVRAMLKKPNVDYIDGVFPFGEHIKNVERRPLVTMHTQKMSAKWLPSRATKRNRLKPGSQLIHQVLRWLLLLQNRGSKVFCTDISPPVSCFSRNFRRCFN